MFFQKLAKKFSDKIVTIYQCSQLGPNMCFSPRGTHFFPKYRTEIYCVPLGLQSLYPIDKFHQILKEKNICLDCEHCYLSLIITNEIVVKMLKALNKNHNLYTMTTEFKMSRFPRMA